MERFLNRRSRTRHAEKFVLKGARLFVAWRAPVSRPTKDIDLLGKLRNDPQVVAGAGFAPSSRRPKVCGPTRTKGDFSPLVLTSM
jgi:hypothetical protein